MPSPEEPILTKNPPPLRRRHSFHNRGFGRFFVIGLFASRIFTMESGRRSAWLGKSNPLPSVLSFGAASSIVRLAVRRIVATYGKPAASQLLGPPRFWRSVYHSLPTLIDRCNLRAAHFNFWLRRQSIEAKTPNLDIEMY